MEDASRGKLSLIEGADGHQDGKLRSVAEKYLCSNI